MNIFEEEIIRPISMEEFQQVFTPEIKQVIKIVRKYGFDIRVVGGAVRDFLLGRPPRDVDFATDADPAELILIYDLEGIPYDAGGIQHGTIKAVFGEDKIDVTSLGYAIEQKDGGMAITKAIDWEQDAQGRDLTINSLSLDLNGNIHDYVGGIQDLKDHVIRLNNSQYHKIANHPEIILRWFKAISYFADSRWPRDDFDLIKRHIQGIAELAGQEKTAKILASIRQAPNGTKIIKLMCNVGAGQYIDIDCI